MAVAANSSLTPAEHDVVLREVVLGGPQGLVVSAQRAAAIAADEAGGVQPRGHVTLALQHGQAHEGLHAAHEGAARCQAVLVVQRGGFQGLADGRGQRCIHVGTPGQNADEISRDSSVAV
jgi:hypothetical protein